MLSGIDVSHYQEGREAEFAENDFVIFKASEGKSWYDPCCDHFYDVFSGRTDGKPVDKCYGFYHYARPEYNTPYEEVHWFLSKIGHHVGHALFALDVEGEAAHSKYAAWVATWMEYFTMETGVRPLLYASQSPLKYFSAVQRLNCGLWVASRGIAREKLDIGDWRFWAIWQYGVEDGIDRNLFNGDVNQWKKYCHINEKLKINR